jgi:hypothetical protein
MHGKGPDISRPEESQLRVGVEDKDGLGILNLESIDRHGSEGIAGVGRGS